MVKILEVKGKLSEADKSEYNEKVYNIIYNEKENTTYIWKKEITENIKE